MNFDLEYLEKLAELVKDNDLSEITLEDGNKTVSLRREKLTSVANVVTTPAIGSAVTTSQVVSPSSEHKVSVKNTQQKGRPIVSPMVGTFYSSPSPNDPPFVNIGDNISVGQIICIVEAMKLMNEIEADISGKITQICVKNGDSVEFGQVLMYVE